MLFLVEIKSRASIELNVGNLMYGDVIYISAKNVDEARILLQNFFLLKVVHNKYMEFSDIFDEMLKLPFPFDAYYNGYSSTYFNYSIFHIEYKNGYVDVVKYTYEN
jgi:hypothetical protein